MFPSQRSYFSTNHDIVPQRTVNYSYVPWHVPKSEELLLYKSWHCSPTDCEILLCSMTCSEVRGAASLQIMTLFPNGLWDTPMKHDMFRSQRSYFSTKHDIVPHWTVSHSYKAWHVPQSEELLPYQHFIHPIKITEKVWWWQMQITVKEDYEY